jgi:glycine cleavage system H protein
MTPDHLRYTTDHEWVRIDDDGMVVIGITDFAQKAMGDVVYLQLPEVGSTVTAGATVAEVESIKSVAEVYLPFAGTISEVNGRIETSPEMVNLDPYGEGWLVKLRPDAAPDLGALMDAAAYDAHTASA